MRLLRALGYATAAALVSFFPFFVVVSSMEAYWHALLALGVLIVPTVVGAYLGWTRKPKQPQWSAK